MLTLIFLPNLGMGGSPAEAPVADDVAGKPSKPSKPGRRRYTLPDGRRVLATDEQIRRILAEYQARAESDLSKIDLPPQVEQVAGPSAAPTPEEAPPPASLMAPLVELAKEVGPQLVMEITDDLSKDEAIALGRMIEQIEDDEAVVALLLLN